MDMYQIEKNVAYKIADIYEAKIAKLTTVSVYSHIYGWIVSEVTIDLQSFIKQVETRAAANNEGKAVHNILLKVALMYQELMLAEKASARLEEIAQEHVKASQPAAPVEADVTVFIDAETTIKFYPVEAVDCTHRVIINRKAVDWLQWKYEPGTAAAKYFHNKHVLKIDDVTLLEKAVKKEKTPDAWTKAGFIKWLNKKGIENVGVTGVWTVQDLPLERYIEEMKKAGKWNCGMFKVDGIHHSRARWMDRFNHFCQDKAVCSDVYGIECVRWIQGETWNVSKYDTSPYTW